MPIVALKVEHLWQSLDPSTHGRPNGAVEQLQCLQICDYSVFAATELQKAKQVLGRRRMNGEFIVWGYLRRAGSQSLLLLLLLCHDLPL